MVWVGNDGVGGCVDKVVQVDGKQSGDPINMDWWRNYIEDGNVRFAAIVCFGC